MLRMGFVDDVETILKATPEQKQVVLFSATMPPAIKKLTQRYLKDPVDIRIKSKTVTVPTIRQRYWKGKTIHKLDALTRIFEAEPFDGILIFVRTKSMTHELGEKLEARGYAIPSSRALGRARRRAPNGSPLVRGSHERAREEPRGARALGVGRADQGRQEGAVSR